MLSFSTLLNAIPLFFLFIFGIATQNISEQPPTNTDPETILNCSETKSTSTITGNIPLGSQNLPFLTFSCTAHNGSVELQEIIFEHLGASSTTDLSKLYLYENNIRLTSGYSPNSETNSVTIHNIGQTLESGQTLTLTLIGGIEPNAAVASQHAFRIKNKDSIISTANKIEGSFPIGGNSFSMISK